MPVVLAAAIPAAVGLAQTIIGGIRAKKARQALEGQQTPTAAPDKAINDYYQSALNRYQAGPYNSVSYQVNKQAAAQGLGAGLNSAQNARQAVQNAGALSQMYSNNLQKAGALAEHQGDIAFAQYGRAAGAKSSDDKYVFGINQMLPYNKQRELYGAQLGGATMLENQGISNMVSAANNAGSIWAASKGLGTPSGSSSDRETSGGGLSSAASRIAPVSMNYSPNIQASGTPRPMNLGINDMRNWTDYINGRYNQ